MLPRSLKFNHVVGVDLFFINFLGRELTFMNMVCWGTGYQQVEFIPEEQGRTAKTARRALMRGWVRHYGWPEMLICDQGTEFTGTDFVDFVGDHGLVIHFIDSRSPWQNGRTERAGGEGKEQGEKVVGDVAGVTEQELVLNGTASTCRMLSAIIVTLSR